jgi:A/G-specific adenine glycosylase
LKKLIIKGMGRRYFSDKIVKWYTNNSRPLPWRQTVDPYKIWLSEVILQQTRVAQGLPYYLQFTASYPTVGDLAQAAEQEVLRLWQGLGYYTRARNLHKCAKVIVEQHHGQFPGTYQELLKLPGIGQYTAAAIASFAFGEKVAVLDGNVFRILSRIFGIETPVNSPEAKKAFYQLAGDLLPDTNAGVHNQAVMEFGALFCTPHHPKCQDCPFNKSCVAFVHGLVKVLPVKRLKKKSRKRYFFYLVFQKESLVLMKKRVGKDIWHGLFDFVLVERERATKPENLLEEKELEKWLRNTSEIKVSRLYKHILTHQTIHCRFIVIQSELPLEIEAEGLSFYSSDQIAQLPKPALITRFLNEQNTD